MTTMVSPPLGAGHFMHTVAPRSGILLNASPTSSAPNSPKHSSYLAPRLSNAGSSGVQQVSLSSHSSASSSTSSTDDIVSSTSATSTGVTYASSSSATAHQAPRKIRFAPLPEPRRDDYDDDLLSPGYFNDIDSASSSPNYVAQLFSSPPVSPNVRPVALTHSPHLQESQDQASCSTLGLSLDGADLPDSGQATETNTIVGSECGTDDTYTLANSRRKARWSRLLPFTKPTSLKGMPRTPDEHSGQFTLWRTSSRESTASCSSRMGGLGHFFGSLSDSNANASSSSLGNPLSRRRTANGSDSVPVSPLTSFRGGLSLKPVVSEAGTAATPAPRSKGRASTSSAPSTVRRQTRLLNGRVYGSRRPGSAGGPAKNPFANIRDTEPEFVEWGHGGMGSVRSDGPGSSQWARLQSSKRLSVGHDDGEGTVAGDEDDGGGMSWVKKRREQREREKKEREEREAKEKAEKKEDVGDGESKAQKEGAETEGAAREEEVERAVSGAPMAESELSKKEVSWPVIPADASEQKEVRDELASGEKHIDETIEMDEGKDKKEKEHVYTAVAVPAPRPHRHLSQSSRQNSLNSTLQTPVRSTVHTPTAEMPPHIIATSSPLGSPGQSTSAFGPSPLAQGALNVADDSPTPSSSASSSYEEESPLGEKDEDRDEGDEDDEEEANEQARKTAIGAGVEKVSRHKE